MQVLKTASTWGIFFSFFKKSETRNSQTAHLTQCLKAATKIDALPDRSAYSKYQNQIFSPSRLVPDVSSVVWTITIDMKSDWSHLEEVVSNGITTVASQCEELQLGCQWRHNVTQQPLRQSRACQKQETYLICWKQCERSAIKIWFEKESELNQICL